MRNYINLNLAERQELEAEEIEDLNRMHFLMDKLKTCWVEEVSFSEHIAKSSQPSYLEACHWLECEMQKTWGFTEDHARHTHRNFFKLPDNRVRAEDG
jgi:hypothetical protein